MPLYVFGGYPRCGLNAKGLQAAIDQVEDLAILEHAPSVQYRKEGVFVLGELGAERKADISYWISPTLIRAGITWDWFFENWTFGNGVTIHKTVAIRELMTVDHGSGQELESLLQQEMVDFSRLRIRRVPKHTEGWAKYEARWLPGTCPQESHVMHLTWLVAKHQIPQFALKRIRELVESPDAKVKERDRYDERHFSPERVWRPARPKMPALT